MHLLMRSNTKSLTAPQAPQLISAGRCGANRTKGILERRHYAVLHNSGKACRPRVHGLSRLHSHILKGMEREAKATPLPSSRALQHLQGLGPDSPVLHSFDTLVPVDREPAQAQRDSDQTLPTRASPETLRTPRIRDEETDGFSFAVRNLLVHAKSLATAPRKSI